MAKGVHGTTFGGGPLAMAVGNAVLDVMTGEGFFEQVRRVAGTMQQGMESLKGRYPELVLDVSRSRVVGDEHLDALVRAVDEAVIDLIFWVSLAGLFGARLLFLAQNPGSFLGIASLINPRAGGLVFYGAPMLGIPVALAIIKRHALGMGSVLDVFGLAVPLAHAFARLGCLGAGCCYGTPSELPWAVTYHHALAPGPRGLATRWHQVPAASAATASCPLAAPVTDRPLSLAPAAPASPPLEHIPRAYAAYSTPDILRTAWRCPLTGSATLTALRRSALFGGAHSSSPYGEQLSRVLPPGFYHPPSPPF
jgi:hypothetical protein